MMGLCMNTFRRASHATTLSIIVPGGNPVTCVDNSIKLTYLQVLYLTLAYHITQSSCILPAYMKKLR